MEIGRVAMYPPKSWIEDREPPQAPQCARCSVSVGGLGFRVQGLGFRVQGLGFRVQGLGFRV